MNVMTVKIYPKNGKFAFETDAALPHAPGKFIAGFARTREEAEMRAIDYACGPVAFISAES